jgi:hypothetical protein
MELQAIRGSMNESPPPPPAGASVREWFAGLALMNSELMKDLPSAARAVEAVRLADELILALAAPRVPSQESMAAPTEAKLLEWSGKIADKREAKVRQGRETVKLPGVKKPSPQTAAYCFSDSMSQPQNDAEKPTAGEHFRRASEALKPGVGKYLMIPPSQLNAEELDVE